MATAPKRRRLGRRLAIDECAVRKPFVFATVFSDPERGVVVDVAPGRDGAAIWAFAGLYSRQERAGVQVRVDGLPQPLSAVRIHLLLPSGWLGSGQARTHPV
jgi:transposase